MIYGPPPQVRPYQELMIRHIYNTPRCGLFARMGAGKTMAVLTALDRLTLTDTVFPAIIFAPKRVAVSTWPAEVKKWAHLRHLKVRVIDGTATERKKAALTGGADIYCIAYDNIQWLAKVLDGSWFWPTVVCDESTRLKGFRLRQGSKRAQALAKIAHTRAERWINLTGTPAPNGLQDLWGQQWFIDRGERLFKTFTSFRDMFFIEGRNGKLIPQRGVETEIGDRIADVCLTIDPRDYMDVKQPNVVRVSTTMPPEAAAKYKRLKKDLLVELEGQTISAANAAILSMKLRQFASGFLYSDGDTVPAHAAKLDVLESIFEEQAGAPLLVAYYFKGTLAALVKRFPQARVLDAKTSTIDEWNRGEIPMLLAHYKSAGHGLNLAEGGCDMALIDHDFNMEEREQIIERIGPTRQAQAGLDRVVNLYEIVVEGSIDSLVLSRTAGKVGVNDALMNHLKEDA